MNLETFQIPVLLTALVALTSLILIPAATMAMSRLPMETSTKSTDSIDGPACDLPPYMEIEEREGEAFVKDLPPLDKRVPEKHKTATFAMG